MDVVLFKFGGALCRRVVPTMNVKVRDKSSKKKRRSKFEELALLIYI